MLVASVLTLTVAQLLDLVTFDQMIHRVGAGAEANPLVSAIFDAGGMPAVAITKVVVIAVVVAVVAALADRPTSRLARTLIAVILGIGILAGMVGGVSNAAAIALS